ncbi:hypothetical protein [Paracidovorax konjaci]|uniref:Uncharacterized protein n=1 Tax=Paracidovorax konjaci TaxID=32040 RepID=A0A1I1VAL5_9BURK|nr:hypothetical protein [Paracidovorax konjaci]SFD79939.1 hypothetical protein SAMN04489710_106162 [Paracidovorax konjaci]
MFSNNGKIGAQRFVPADRPPAQGEARPGTGTPTPRHGGMLQGDGRLSGLTSPQRQRAPSGRPGSDAAGHHMPASMRQQPRAQLPAHRHGPESPTPMSRGGGSLFTHAPPGPAMPGSIEDSFSRFSLHGQGSGQGPVHGDRYGQPHHAHSHPGRDAFAGALYHPAHSASADHALRPSWGNTPHPSGTFESHAPYPSAHHPIGAGLPQPAPHWTDSLKKESLDDWFAKKDGARGQPGMSPHAHSTPPHSPRAGGPWAPSAPPWNPAPPDLHGAPLPQPREPHWTDHLEKESLDDWLAEKDWGRDLSGTESVGDWALQKEFGRDLSGTESVADWAMQKAFGRDLLGTESVAHFAWRQDVGLTYGAPPLPAGGLYASPPHSPQYGAALPPWHAPAAHGHSRNSVTQATDEALRMMEQTMRAQQSAMHQGREHWRS